MERRGSPFPGMDPYLEHPAVFPGVHDALVTYVRDELAPQLPPRYYADLRDRLFVGTAEDWISPDVSVSVARRSRARTRSKSDGSGATAVLVEVASIEVREPYVEIRDAETGHRVVTVVEVLSPTNKRAGSDGRKEYLAKQRKLLSSTANLVEIDLLRGGEHTVAVPPGPLKGHRPFHYLVVARRAHRPGQRQVYPIRLSWALPEIRIPLLPGDAEPTVNLQACVKRAYRMGAYARRIDYRKPPVPALGAGDATWAARLTARAR